MSTTSINYTENVEKVTIAMTEGEEITIRVNEYARGATGPQSYPVPSATPPADPIDGTQWLDSTTWILSIWSASESAWIVPATNSIPATAFLSPSLSPYLSPSGAYYLAAA